MSRPTAPHRDIDARAEVAAGEASARVLDGRIEGNESHGAIVPADRRCEQRLSALSLRICTARSAAVGFVRYAAVSINREELMLKIVLVTLLLPFTDFASAQQPETAPATVPAANLQIAKLPTSFEGRYERTLPSLQKIGNTTKFTITSQDENGKILGKFTSWGGGSPCSSVIDIPMEGEYDGATLVIRATPTETGCSVWRLTLKPGVSHMFEWKSSETGDTIGRTSVAGVATAYYDPVK